MSPSGIATPQYLGRIQATRLGMLTNGRIERKAKFPAEPV